MKIETGGSIVILLKFLFIKPGNYIRTMILTFSFKKRMKLDLNRYTILQILSITLFEKMFLLQALAETDYKNKINSCNMQLYLYES